MTVLVALACKRIRNTVVYLLLLLNSQRVHLPNETPDRSQ